MYIDDLIIAGNNAGVIAEFKQYLNTTFHMKDLEILRYFLGIEVAHNPSGIYLCQRKYAVDIITETGLLGVKPVSFSLEKNHKLTLVEDNDMKAPSRYCRLIGRLIYLGVIRPGLSYVIHILSQFMTVPQEEHLNAALRVACYLKNSHGQGILFCTSTDLKLTAWCDSDWASCPLTNRSLTGWFIQLDGSLVSWKTKKQDVVSRSSCEAKYRVMADTVSELLWFRQILPAMGIECSDPIVLHSDSLSAINLAANPVYHTRTKHVCNDCHFIQDESIRGEIATKHVSTKSQLTYIMTKVLD